MGSFAPAEYVRRVAAVMEACSEEDEPLFLERGERLYNVLREVYHYARQDSPQRLADLFSDDLTALIRQSWDRIREKAAGGRGTGEGGLA
jgi:hypothetical protein